MEPMKELKVSYEEIKVRVYLPITVNYGDMSNHN